MLAQNVISPRCSSYNSPLWVVPKKPNNSGKQKWRIVIDYRKLNEQTIDDKFPLPNIEHLFDKLGKFCYISTIDLAKGFHQIEVHPDDRAKTAFSTASGHYEFNRMPFGLKTAPATFQRLINHVLRDHINKICVAYLDDILIFSTSFQEHIESIKKICSTLQDTNLKIQIDKCHFAALTTKYLGHLVTGEGIKPDL
uniref:Retrovirus-related Pol polyprotein from transposon 297 n=1 Tax=Bactrocera latifrons TaxID=174628 RepID=A0A0K8VBC8_BACLA